MFIDARSVSAGSGLDTDLCIIGAGAAGIAMARDFAGSGLRVFVLESGGRKMDRETQALYEGECVGLNYELDTTRARYFGGSTNLWGGFCRPFEPFHFEARDWVPNSGWPIGPSELSRYFAGASEVCGLDPDGYNLQHWDRKTAGQEIGLIEQHGASLESSLYQRATKCRRFGTAYADELKRSDVVRVFLHANVTEIRASDCGTRVEAVEVACLGGNRFTVKARAFVLATGGLENARLLLSSRGVHGAGLGNQYDLVGRYFMEHPRMQVGFIQSAEFASLLDLYDTRFAVLNAPIVADIGLTAEAQRAEQLLSWSAHIEARPKAMKSGGVLALFDLYSGFKSKQLPEKTLAKAGCVLASPRSVASFLLGYRFRLARFIEGYEIAAKIEQCPNPASRVTLSAEKDRLGMNKLRLDWRLTELDHRTAARSAEILAEELRETSSAPLRFNATDRDRDWLAAPGWTWHHMGTTRMHDDPKLGVVDRDCRVHGLGNLFVAGSSVFPTAGQNVPTLTIIALALRLSAQLKRTMLAQD